MSEPDSHIDSREALVVAGHAESLPTTLALDRLRRRLFDVDVPPTQLGRFQLLDVLGRGAEGVAYAAYDPELDRRVALKLLRPHLESDGSNAAAARLLGEAKALAQLSHPNVVTVYEVGQTQGRAFIAMELVEGCDLSTWTEREGAALDWRRRLAVLMAAGRGLAAAHEKNTIHRDFKPANVLIGHDGRVRVSDFGLARLFDTSPTTDSSPEGLSRTQEGSSSPTAVHPSNAAVGTPYYMAPEQYGGRTTILSDVYAFCMTAHEVLYGQLPFSMGPLAQLIKSKLAGPPMAPASARKIPRRIRRAIRRGLDPAEDRRWPSMKALLRELEVASAPIPRASWAVLAASVLALGGLMAAAVNRNSPTCTGAELHLAGVWDNPLRERIAATYTDSDVFYAKETYQRLQPALDTYAAGWTTAYQQTCEASQRGEQSPDLLDRKMMCLRGRLIELRELVGVIARAEPEIIERASTAVEKLAPVASCVDVTTENQLAPVPEHPEAVAAQRVRLAQVNALIAAGLYSEVGPQAQDIVAQARTIGDSWLLADALYRDGKTEGLLGHYDRAEELLEEALWTAQAAGNGGGQILSATGLAWVLGVWVARPQEALRWVRYAKAQIEHDRAGALLRSDVLQTEASIYENMDASTRARETSELAISALQEAGAADQQERLALLLGNIATSYHVEGRFEQSIEYNRRALALLESALGFEHPQLIGSLSNLATGLLEMAQFAEADRLLRRAVSIAEHAFGPDNIELTDTLNDVAASYYRQGQIDAAQQIFERVLAIRQKALAPDHPDIAATLGNIGAVLLAQGKFDQAANFYEESLAILENHAAAQGSVLAANLNNLAVIRARQGRYKDAADLYQRTLALYEEVLGAEHPTTAKTRSNIGDLWNRQGRFAEARTYYEQALATLEKTLGSDHPDLMSPLSSLAGAFLAEGKPTPAIAPLERALAIGAAANAPPEEIGKVEFQLADALWDAHRERARALHLARSARERFAAPGSSGQDILREVDDWLARRPRGKSSNGGM